MRAITKMKSSSVLPNESRISANTDEISPPENLLPLEFDFQPVQLALEVEIKLPMKSNCNSSSYKAEGNSQLS